MKNIEITSSTIVLKMDKNKQFIIDEINRGNTIKSIAKKLDLDRKYITDWMKRNKIKIPTAIDLIDVNKIRHDYKNEKLSIHKIADKYGVSRNTAKTFMYKNGIMEIPGLDEKLDPFFAQIEKALKNKKSTVKLAKDYGVEYGYFAAWLEKNGIKKETNYEMLDRNRNDVLLSAKRIGMNKTAERLGITVGMLWKWLYRNNEIKYREKAMDYLAKNQEKIQNLRSGGYSRRKIASVFQVDKSTLDKFLKEF